MILSRRRFLKLGTLTAAALTVTPSRASARALFYAGRPKHVVIVGAGLAGLAAALDLVETGNEVTILEAQARPGGRVLTLRDPFNGELYADMGAARIPTHHEWTLRYAQRFGLALTPFWPHRHDEIHLLRGRRIVARAGAEMNLRAYPVSLTEREHRMGWDAIQKALYASLLDIAGNPAAPDWPPPALRRYDAFTPTAYAIAEGWSRDVDFLMGLGYNDPDGANGALLEDIREIAHEPGGGMGRAKIVGGMDLLPRAMAARLTNRIRYGRVVERIEQDAGEVRVRARGIAGPEMYMAERAIVTAPFPPLRRIEFVPALSAGKQRAIREMRYEPLSRVALQVRARPWVGKDSAPFAKTDLPSEVWDTSWDQSAERGIVSVYLKNDASLRLANMDEGERISFAAEHAEKVFPGVRGVVEHGASKVWTEDPWAGGANAWLAPGQLTALKLHAATVEGRVHFAGEHTSAWHGWMQGALQSGHRVAKEVDAVP